ncbi:MAG TPA: translesion DNA synthesis-associated protein ImuA [Steroidobacteraceae bacterium]|nr:translesion DNA synthesis-associated protein ImuA [Steroidobacteraceae bacterium]
MKPAPVPFEQLAELCRHGQRRHGPRDALPSGFVELDAHLPGGGWPSGAVAELMSDAVGIGELGLLMPALSNLARQGRYVILIAPPYLPYPPALMQRGLPLERVLMIHTSTLQQTLWATEQALRCPAVGAALSWPACLVDRNVRRLQLAAEAGGSTGFLYRPPAAALEPSPAALRLRLHEDPSGGLIVDIQKSRGGRAGMRLRCTNSDALAVHSSAAAAA